MEYSGLRFEGLGGSRLGNNFALDLIGGAFVDIRKRKADVDTDAYSEKQKIAAVRLGLGLYHRVGTFRYRTSAGAKFPFYSKFTESRYNNADFEFSGDGVASPFVKRQFNRGVGGTKAIQINVFYDTLKFKESEEVGAINARWPKKEYSRIGAQAVFYF